MSINFNFYGLFVGLGVVVTWHLAGILARKQGIKKNQFDRLAWLAVIGGVIGARLYHVIGEWWKYWPTWWQALAIWRGGLSIIGAAGGGAIAVWWSSRRQPPTFLALIADIVAMAAPIGQAIGRWGNYFNQELMGYPTTLPWGIYISETARPIGFEDASHFHPLFFYEILGLLPAIGLLWLGYHRRWWQLGKGMVAAGYLMYYAGLRIGLDFLRIEKTQLANTGIGVNQLILLLILTVAGWYWLRQWVKILDKIS